MDGSALANRFEQRNVRAMPAVRCRRALFLLDHALHWIGGNEPAERMVAAGWWRASRGARLDSPSEVTRAALYQAEQWSQLPGTATYRAIPVYDRLADLVAFGILQPCALPASGECLSRYLLVVRAIASAGDSALAAQLRTLFDLAPDEAALAVTLRHHRGLQGAAAALALEEGSARGRLQAVLAKTGMLRPADLLRMLDALADTIG